MVQLLVGNWDGIPVEGNSLAVAIAQQSRRSEEADFLSGLWKRMVGGWRYQGTQSREGLG